MRRQRRSREADGRSAEVQAKLIPPRLGSRIAEELLADGSESPPLRAEASVGPKREGMNGRKARSLLHSLSLYCGLKLMQATADSLTATMAA